MTVALLLALALTWLVAATAVAATPCSISGTVVNDGGYANSDTVVALYDQAGGVVTTTGVDPAGAFTFAGLVPGTYRVGFAVAPGFDLYLPCFYDNAVTLEDADPITLTDESPSFAAADGVLCWAGYHVTTPSVRDDGDWKFAQQWDVRGQVLAVSGDVAVVGAPYVYGRPVNQSGAVYVYARGAAGWRLRQFITSPDPVLYGYFGRVVAVDGDTFVTAQYAEDAKQGLPGRVYVYRLHGSSFKLEAELKGSGDETQFRGFGASVAVAGDTVVVGASRARIGGEPEAGAAYVFTRSSGAWSQTQRLVAPSPSDDTFFADAVALDGDDLIVGAPYEDTAAGVNAGSIYVYRRGATRWEAGSRIRPDDAHIGDAFGAPLALDDGTLLVTAWSKGDWGRVYAFVRSSGGWREQALLPMPKRVGDMFGNSLDLVGDRAVVGWGAAQGDLDTGQSGAVYSYLRHDGVWHLLAEMGYQEKVNQGGVGASVAIAGRETLVTSRQDSYADEIRHYAVRIYRPYVAEAGQPLVVDAGGGVLVNDVAPQGETAQSELATPAQHGAATLASDGSLVYTPAPGFVGTDSFTYQAKSASWTSAPATATVFVQDSSAPTVGIDGIASGWVSAPVTVVLSAEDATAVGIDYRRASVTLWQHYVKPFRVTREGATPYKVRAGDAEGNVRLGSFTVRLDTRRPSVAAPYAASGRSGGSVTFRFKVSDPRPGGPYADVTIEAFRGTASKGSAVLKRQPLNRFLSRSVKCWLTRGTYRFVVTAVDAAGNTQRAPVSNRLVVK